MCFHRVLSNTDTSCLDNESLNGSDNYVAVLTLALSCSALTLSWRMQSMYNLLLHLTRRATMSDILKSLYEPEPGEAKTATGASEDPCTAAAVKAAHSEL